MSRIRGRGNQETDIALVKLLRQHGIKGWRRHFEIRKAESGNSESNPISFPQSAAGGVCGWLFLAWLPEARDQTEKQSRFLATQTFRQQNTRPAGEPDFAVIRLAGGSDLGMCVAKETKGVFEKDFKSFGLVETPQLFESMFIHVHPPCSR